MVIDFSQAASVMTAQFRPAHAMSALCRAAIRDECQRAASFIYVVLFYISAACLIEIRDDSYALFLTLARIVENGLFSAALLITRK